MIDPKLVSKLNSIPDLTLYTAPSDCWAYGSDNSRRHACPDAVVIPHSSQQVETIVQLCYEYSTPIIARGRASGTTGGCVPLYGGIVLSIERLNQICHFDPKNRTMDVEAGVLNSDVQRLAQTEGLFWGPDPSSRDYCTVGGNIACCAAGPRAIKYGTTRENVLGLSAVIGTGEVMRTGVYTTKGVVGYDLTRLIIGSEGTLGIVTKATLKLLPLPTKSIVACAYYSDLLSATQAITRIMGQPVCPSALEFMDRNCLSLIRSNHTDIPPNAKAMLIIAAEGTQKDIDHQINALKAAASFSELIKFEIANNKTEIKKIWQVRKALSPALRKLSPHKINEDIVVPVSKIPELIEHIEQLAKKYQFNIVNFGHAGNGNIHVNILADLNDSKVGPRALECLNSVFDKVLSLKGTLSGEHGVGIEKRDYVLKEIDPIALRLMKQIKSQFDPKSILNPNKLFLSN